MSLRACKAFVTSAAVFASAVAFAAASIASADGHGGHASPDKKGVCDSSKPCVTDNNSGSGSALLGEATSGNAVQGEATTGSGVNGSATGSGAGVYGSNASTGSGVYGYSVSGPGVSGQAHYGIGLSGYSTDNDGVSGETGSPSSAGVYGYSSAGGQAMLAQASATAYGLVVEGGTSDGGAPNVLRAFDSNEDQYLIFDDSGNLTVTGVLYTDGQCRNGCTKTRHEASYAAQTSTPTLDDVGEAALRDGHAHVALDAALQNAIDVTKPYVVLLTPEGDAPLYVANRTAAGFDVAEIGGGHSSVAFAYRIVAHPYGRTRARLPFVTHTPLAIPRRRHR